MSVGKLGYGSVVTFVAFSPSGHETSNVVGLTSLITTPTSAQFCDHALEMIRTAVFDLELSPRQRGGDDKGSGFDSIGNDRVFRAAKRFDALDLDRLGSGAVNARAHLVEQVGEIDDFRFARRVVKCGCAARERGCHHQVFSSGDGNFVEVNFGRAQTSVLRRARNDISRFEFYFRAKLFKSREMQIDRPRADRATARQRNFRFAKASEQWSKRKH